MVMRLLVSETKLGSSPLLRRLLLDGRRARWGGWGLAFALLRRKGVGWVCLWLSSRATIAVGERVLSASGELDEVVEGGACTFEQGVSGSRVDARMGVVCERLQRWAAATACMALFPWFPSLAAGFVVVLRENKIPRTRLFERWRP
eukprot:scaffold13951_cov104-Isochrysis_galbana.AAC.1